MDSQENQALLRSKISSSVEDSELIERLKKRKEKVKEARPKVKDTKDGDTKEKGKESKDVAEDRSKKRAVARTACGFCHIPYQHKIHSFIW